MSHAREHEFEPQHGLPEPLPRSERILWQGTPDWRVLARRAFHVRKVAVYFGLLVALRALLMLDEGAGLVQVVVAASWLAVLGAVSTGLLATLAWLSARSTVYTLTDRRIVMRIGIVLTLTYNIPYARIVGAGLRAETDGHGDIALSLNRADRIAWLHLWPHVRPWRMAHPEPMLRALPRAAEVARALTDAWAASTGQIAAAAVTPEGRNAGSGFGAAPTALAGR